MNTTPRRACYLRSSAFLCGLVLVLALAGCATNARDPRARCPYHPRWAARPIVGETVTQQMRDLRGRFTGTTRDFTLTEFICGQSGHVFYLGQVTGWTTPEGNAAKLPPVPDPDNRQSAIGNRQ